MQVGVKSTELRPQSPASLYPMTHLFYLKGCATLAPGAVCGLVKAVMETGKRQRATQVNTNTSREGVRESHKREELWWSL